MEKLSEKAAMISGAVTGGVLHVLFGLAFWASPGMVTGMNRMMWYGSTQYGAGAFSAYSLLGSIVLGIVVGGIVGYIIAVSYNWGLKK